MTVETSKRGLPEEDTRSILTGRGLTSGASWIGSADVALQDRFLSELDEGELMALPFLFEFWAMPHQLPPDGTWRSWVIMGGRGAYGDAATLRQLQSLREVAAEMYPQLAGVEWQHAWGGFVAVTADHYPHLNLVGDGIIAGLGYNGRGVAMATAMGRVMADWALGRPEPELDFPVTPLRPIPLHGLRRLGVAANVARYRLLDRLGL